MADDLEAKLAALQQAAEDASWQAQLARAEARHHAATLREQRKEIKTEVANTRRLVHAAYRTLRGGDRSR